MLDLIEAYEKNPNCNRINLDLRNVKDLTPLVISLNRFKNLNDLSLHGNKLTSLPPLQSLVKLTNLDISNNPIKIDNYLLDRLFQIKRLEHLRIDASHEQLVHIVEHLPKLVTINGQKINRHIIKKQKLDEQKEQLQVKLLEELGKMKDTYNHISNLLESEMNEKSIREQRSKKQDEFDFLYKDITEEMKYFYNGLEDKLSLQGVFAYCKNKLTVVLDNLMIRILDQLSNDHIVKAYEEVSRIKAQNFDQLLRIIFNLSYERHMNEEIDRQTNRFRKETLYLNEIFRMKKEVAAVKQEQNKIDRLNEKEIEIINETTNKYQGKARYSSKSRTPKSNADFSVPIKSTSNRSYQLNPKQKSMSKSPSKVLSKSPSKVMSRSPSSALNRTPSKRTISKGQSQKQSARYRGQKSSEPNKILSLQQLLSLIEEIMLEKRKFNNKSLQKNESYETTEQFLFSFFSRKYGLKDLALDWSLSLIKSIEKYCRQSLEVEVFGKILKNKLYQLYYDECKVFKSKVSSVLRRERRTQTINQDEFRKIFLYFFSCENPQTIDRIIKETQFPIQTEDFSYFLQSYKLAFEQRHMKKFINLFQQLDSGCSGGLTQAQCRVLYTELLKEKQLQADQYQKMIEPLNIWIRQYPKDRFIFSEVFQLVHTLL